MRTVELFCGTKSFSKVAASRGHSTFTVDIDGRHRPDLRANIRLLRPTDIPHSADVFWASPPCQCFSTICIARYWNADGSPTAEVYEAIALVTKSLVLALQSRACWWFIENPRGMLRTVEGFDRAVALVGGVRRTISYCQYGDTRMKPTDIWTNATWWKPRPLCRNGGDCHERGGRDLRTTGTLGLKDAVERSRIPEALFHEIFDHMPCPVVEAAE